MTASPVGDVAGSPKSWICDTTHFATILMIIDDPTIIMRITVITLSVAVGVGVVTSLVAIIIIGSQEKLDGGNTKIVLKSSVNITLNGPIAPFELLFFYNVLETMAAFIDEVKRILKEKFGEKFLNIEAIYFPSALVITMSSKRRVSLNKRFVRKRNINLDQYDKTTIITTATNNNNTRCNATNNATTQLSILSSKVFFYFSVNKGESISVQDIFDALQDLKPPIAVFTRCHDSSTSASSFNAQAQILRLLLQLQHYHQHTQNLLPLLQLQHLQHQTELTSSFSTTTPPTTNTEIRSSSSSSPTTPPKTSTETTTSSSSTIILTTINTETQYLVSATTLIQRPLDATNTKTIFSTETSTEIITARNIDATLRTKTATNTTTVNLNGSS
ncbi:unnamed protein product [Rotaria magnacalcarata]|uniref:Uncharacterized protein n=2 Tax=Rotaria magnacalcarata TaxID=392030 RepID=A0A814R1Z0_9BILA|nr:unnamed protein product [Rotaria magnacalcarata]CAF2045475.1 unnamed protein product [Rotaria magnacalcarata]CAF3852522.1 unnamed protein product [Rotaria magnacalcarata]